VRGESAYSELGDTGLLVSHIGFGAYRVDDRVGPHGEALARALGRGVNVVDTSTNYGDGHSERLVGRVLADLDRAGTVSRSSVVVVSKIGYAQGENLEIAKAHEEGGKPYPEMVKLGEELWHSIHPTWLEDQLERSLERLGIEALDVCLLHNPEYFLAEAAARRVPIEEARSEFYRRVTAAFRHFEEEVKRGRLRYYGVSSNTLGAPTTDPEVTDLSRFLRAAKDAAGDAHHFRVAELPLNLLESGPVLEPSTGDGAETALAFARRERIAVLVNRPLNAIVENRLVRLADPPDYAEAPSFGEQLQVVKGLEAEFARDLAPSIRLAKSNTADAAAILRWADQLGSIGADLDGLEQWRDIETQAVLPRVMQTVTALDRALAGAAAVRWQAFKERYLGELEALLLSLRKRAADRSRRKAMAVTRVLDPLIPAERRPLPLSQKALLVLSSVPGVTTVLVGMRETGYVADALSAAGLPPLDDAEAILSAARAVELP